MVCNEFIKGRGFTRFLDLEEDIINYLKRYDYISKNGDYGYALNDKFYKNYKKDIESLGLTKFQKELIKEYSPFTPIYLDGELMHLFLNNPNFHFSWSGYMGYVCSTDESKLDIYIKNVCLSHDLKENKIVIGIFLVDLIDLSYQSQIMLEPFMLENKDDRYEFHQYNIKNLIYGAWLNVNEEDIYTILLEGIKIVNYIFEQKYGFKIYKNEYECGDLQFFMPLFYPTKINRFNFCMEIYKVFLDNINKKSLKKKIIRDYDKMPNKSDIDMVKLEKGEYGIFSLFKLYFGQYKQFYEISYNKLDEIRNLRTEPAHQIYINDLNFDYCKEQDEILINLYRIINNIIKVEDNDYKYLKEYKNGDYVCFYGEHGSILQKNGFNSKQYRYYDGYLRLNNDKFQVRDAEILIAGNSKEEIKQILQNHFKNNSDLKEDDIKYIIDIILNSEICIPTNRELRSFFYGHAYLKQFYNEIRNYKRTGMKLYEDFLKKGYKYFIILADSSELYWNINKTLQIIKKDKEDLFGCGIILHLLTNNFSNDDSNIFNVQKNNMLFLNNVWD